MDPLSCAASVLAVIQVAGAVANICGDYIKQVKKAQKDINDLTGEINSLRIILESLNDILRGPRGGKLITLQEISDDAGKCELILKSLSNKINPETTQSSTRRRGFRPWKWPLQRTEVDEAISQLKGYMSLFVTALQIDHARSHDRFERKFDLRNLKIVEGATYDSFENKHKECLPETRTEVLRQVWDWAESSHGKCIYWLKGGAGTGKSTISRTIGQQLNDKRSLAASFFFKRGEEGRNNSKWLFSTIAQQLAITIPELGPEIQKAVEIDPYISEKVPAEQFNKLLLQPLLNMDLNRTVTLVAVIDALDECQSDSDDDDHDIKVLLRLLPRVQESKSVRLRFFVTSRPELPIRLGFDAVRDNLQNMDLHSIQTSEIAHDISIFLDYSFSRIRHSHGLPAEWPGKEAMNDLLARTVPLFISAATLCRFISTTWDPQDRLQNILNDQSSYVSEMAKTYLPVLNQLLVGQNEREIPRLVQRFKEIVGPIIVLATPLSVNALSQLLGTKSSITSHNIKSLLNWLHSVLIIADDPEVPVRLQHLSFRDFLLDGTTRDTEESAKFWIDEAVIHQRLTDQCLAVMDKKLRKNICMLPDDCLQRSEIDTDSINKHLPPELRYACRYWIQHLMQSHKPADAVEKACSFLGKHFLHWLEVVSILGLVSEIIGAITELQSAVRDSKFPKVRRDLLHDARRFVLKNRHLADTAPLQLYSSGLMFCPESSFTRRIFKDNLSDWSQLPKVEQSWSAEQQTLEGHSGWVLSVTFSPDGKQLASGSSDNTIKLWDPTTGELRQTLEGHSSWVWSKAGAGISILRSQWLCHRNRRILWLPQAYRVICLAINNGVLVLGHVSGRVSFISRAEILD